MPAMTAARAAAVIRSGLCSRPVSRISFSTGPVPAARRHISTSSPTVLMSPSSSAASGATMSTSSAPAATAAATSSAAAARSSAAMGKAATVASLTSLPNKRRRAVGTGGRIACRRPRRRPPSPDRTAPRSRRSLSSPRRLVRSISGIARRAVSMVRHRVRRGGDQGVESSLLNGPAPGWRRAAGSRPARRRRWPGPASRAWLSGPAMPAARLVTIERAATRRPQCLAAIASATVDMPTVSAPSTRSILISAGVSKQGPSQPANTPPWTGMPTSNAAAWMRARSSAS